MKANRNSPKKIKHNKSKNQDDEWRRVKAQHKLLNAPILIVVAKVQQNARVSWSFPILDTLQQKR